MGEAATRSSPAGPLEPELHSAYSGLSASYESLGTFLKFPFSSLPLSYTAPRSPHEL